MNIDRGKESFTEEEVQSLRADLLQYKEYESLSWKKLADRVGVPEGTLSVWGPNKYTGDNQAVAYKVSKFFLAEEARQDLELQAPIVPSFQFTRTAREVIAQCRWAQRGKMVVAVGTSGVGKTGALQQYVATTPNAYMATMSYGARSPSTMLVELLRAMGVTTRGGGSIQTLTHVICDRLADLRATLVLDEAQHLTDAALEQVRHIHDRIKVGLVLSGNQEVLTRIGTRKAGFAQIHSRVSFPHVYHRPYEEDVHILCEAWGVRHPKEREFLQGIAARPGCLRNLTETMELATLMARSSDEDRTLEHMKTAWAQRQLNPAAA